MTREQMRLPPTLDEAAAQAELIVELREKLAQVRDEAQASYASAKRYVAGLQARIRRLERALVATAQRHKIVDLQLGANVSISLAPGGKWMIDNESERYATFLDAFDAASDEP